jgi:hypothetical protein
LAFLTPYLFRLSGINTEQALKKPALLSLFAVQFFSYFETDTMQEKAGTKRAGLIEVLNLAV